MSTNYWRDIPDAADEEPIQANGNESGTKCVRGDDSDDREAPSSLLELGALANAKDRIRTGELLERAEIALESSRVLRLEIENRVKGLL